MFPGQSSVTNQNHLSESQPSQAEELLGVNKIHLGKMAKGGSGVSFKSEDVGPVKRFPMTFPRSSGLFYLLWALSALQTRVWPKWSQTMSLQGPAKTEMPLLACPRLNSEGMPFTSGTLLRMPCQGQTVPGMMRKVMASC